MKKLNVAIIGVGGISRIHIPGWHASPYTELVAGCDLNETILTDWGKLHSVSKLTTKPEELFSDPDIDIIDICTPNRTHMPLAVAALQAGKHVICEKPLAVNPDEIRQMIIARDASGKMLMAAQHHRFRGVSLAMQAEIASGILGDVYHARAWTLRRAGIPTKPTFMRLDLSGGGAGLDMGVHILDMTLWLMGNPKPVTVSGIARTELAKQEGAISLWGGNMSELEVEEFAAAFVRFANGATLLLEASWMLHHPTPKEQLDEMQMWLYGTKGGAHWPKGEIYDSNPITKQHYNRELQRTDDKLPPHAQQCVEFANAIVQGLASPVPAEASLNVMTILQGIYQSNAVGREVAVKGV